MPVAIRLKQRLFYQLCQDVALAGFGVKHTLYQLVERSLKHVINLLRGHGGILIGYFLWWSVSSDCFGRFGRLWAEYGYTGSHAEHHGNTQRENLKSFLYF